MRAKIYIVVPVVLTFIFLYVCYENRRVLYSESDCAGDIYSSYRGMTFDGNIEFYVSGTSGYSRISGTLILAGNTKKTVSRVIYFSVMKEENQYLLMSKKVEKSKTDNVSDNELASSVPDFYVYEHVYFPLLFKKLTNGWLLYTSKIPSLYCTFL